MEHGWQCLQSAEEYSKQIHRAIMISENKLQRFQYIL